MRGPTSHARLDSQAFKLRPRLLTKPGGSSYPRAHDPRIYTFSHELTDCSVPPPLAQARFSGEGEKGERAQRGGEGGEADGRDVDECSDRRGHREILHREIGEGRGKGGGTGGQLWPTSADKGTRGRHLLLAAHSALLRCAARLPPPCSTFPRLLLGSPCRVLVCTQARAVGYDDTHSWLCLIAGVTAGIMRTTIPSPN